MMAHDFLNLRDLTLVLKKIDQEEQIVQVYLMTLVDELVLLILMLSWKLVQKVCQLV